MLEPEVSLNDGGFLSSENLQRAMISGNFDAGVRHIFPISRSDRARLARAT